MFTEEIKKLGELKTEVKKAERTLEGGPEESRALEGQKRLLKRLAMSLKPRCLSGCSIRLKTLSRRGHWHHYWVGPRDGDMELILKWVAPMFINSGDNIVTIYPVKA